jgi:hypothetical protein
MSAKSLENLLNSSTDEGLGQVIQRARRMGELVEVLQRALPGELAGSVRSANIRDDGTLVVLATSSAWAARLRFEAQSLLAAAAASGAQVSGFAVHVSRDATDG